MHLYGLLYVDESDVSVNVRVKGTQARLAMYVANAANLSRSLRAFGHDFTLLTNTRTALEAYCPGLLQAQGVDVAEIPFTTEVPRDILFYSAHYKFDALRHIAAQPVPYAILVDLDVECIRAFPPSVARIAELGLPIAYDITEQVRLTYGEERIAADLSQMAGTPLPACWYGGELLGGTPAFFARVDAMIQALWPRYVADWRTLHHQGDEMLVTAVLGRLRVVGATVYDAGKLGLIARWWSQRPQHAQLGFDATAATVSLLHLPQDKPYLARRGADPATAYGPGPFAAGYRHVRWTQRVKKTAKSLVGMP